MPRRPRHPVKELEALLREVEKRGWRVDKTQVTTTPGVLAELIRDGFR